MRSAANAESRASTSAFTPRANALKSTSTLGAIGKDAFAHSDAECKGLTY